MTTKLNFFPVELEAEELRIWEAREMGAQEFHDANESGIYFTRIGNNNWCLPCNSTGLRKLETGEYIQKEVTPQNNPKIFSYLIKWGFIRHLKENGVDRPNKSKIKGREPTFELSPIYYDEQRLSENKVDCLFDMDNPLHSFQGYSFLEGLQITAPFFNINYESVIGLCIRHKTGHYFDEGLDKLIEGVRDQFEDFYVQRKVPPEKEEDHELYGKSNLLGEFKQIREIDDEKWVILGEDSRSDIDKIRASEAVFETSFENLAQWAEAKGEDELIDKIREAEGKNETDQWNDVNKYANIRYSRLQSMLNGIDKEFELPNGQKAIMKSELEVDL